MLICVPRSAWSRRTDQAAVAKRIKEICETRVRYGYRRVHVLLASEGWGINVKKVYRSYKKSGMQLRHKTTWRRVKAKLRDDSALPNVARLDSRVELARMTALFARAIA